MKLVTRNDEARRIAKNFEDGLDRITPEFKELGNMLEILEQLSQLDGNATADEIEKILPGLVRLACDQCGANVRKLVEFNRKDQPIRICQHCLSNSLQLFQN